MTHNGEELILARLLGDGPPGFYLDVGANDPYTSSNSHPFYIRGWRGIDVEPLPEMAAKLRAAHPENRVFECAVGSENGRAVLFGQVGWEGATLRSEYVALYPGADRHLFLPLEVELRTLNSILSECFVGAIDFMSMDIEGSEGEALRGLDLNVYRPRVMVIEATVPRTLAPCWDAWEPYVLSHGYQAVEFDGCNRFYVRKEDNA